MQTMRPEDDSLRKESVGRIDAAGAMKRECADVRNMLRKYLGGYVFWHQKIRIVRHLKSCAVCSSELQALRMESDTLGLLHDVNPPEGLARIGRAGASGLARLRKLLYRPLWMAAIVAVALLAWMNAAPRKGDQEIENLERSLPAASSSVPAAAPPPASQAAPAQPQPAPAAAPVPAVKAASPSARESSPAEPLEVTITPENEQAAMRRINEVMRGHASLRKLHLSDSVKEVSGKLAHDELLTFFGRISSSGKVSYSRRRLESFPADQLVPFVLVLKPGPVPAVRQPAPVEPKEYRPAAAEPAPASAQTVSP